MKRDKKRIRDLVIVYTIFFGTIFVWWWFLSIYFSGYGFWGRVGWCTLFSLATYFCIGLVFNMVDRVKMGMDPLSWENDYDDPRKAKGRMLFVMQYGHKHGIEGALKEFDVIFNGHPDWELQKWEPFRSWYKNNIDFMVQYPDCYDLTLGDGRPYKKEDDLLYDPDALDWYKVYQDWRPVPDEL